jgi:transcription elongation factor GreB
LGVSKAFTKEETDDVPVVLPRRAPLPDGVPNYVTPAGLAAYRTELAELKDERAALGAAASDDSELTRKQAIAHARITELEARLAAAQLVEVAEEPRDLVRFGARVTVRDANRREHCYQIVGVDEADPANGRIAFVAPIARALLGRRLGDEVTVRTPHGEEEFEIREILYS